MKINLIAPRVMHLLFETRIAMTLAMCRLQEFYESPFPEIRGHVFTLDDLIAAYAQPDGSIDYFSYWEGFNVPPEAVEAFRHGFKDTSLRELRIISAWQLAGQPYVIATDGDEAALRHELAHARWYSDQRYRADASVILNAMPLTLTHKLWHGLRNGDRYANDPKLLNDEVNAYLAADDETEWEKVFPGVPIADLVPYATALRNLL
jgi:hypothetical protein